MCRGLPGFFSHQPGYLTLYRLPFRRKLFEAPVAPGLLTLCGGPCSRTSQHCFEVLRSIDQTSPLQRNHNNTSRAAQSKRGVDAEFLALLVEGALKQEPLGSHTPSCMSATAAAASTLPPDAANGGAAASGPGGAGPLPQAAPAPAEGGPAAVVRSGGNGGGSGDDLEGRPLCKQVAELLGRVVSATSTRGDARVWEVYARFNEGAGR